MNNSNDKTKAIVSYIIFICALIFLFQKDSSRDLKFHCAQSIVIAIGYILLSFILGFISGLTGIGILSSLAYVAYIVFIILGIVKANNGENPELTAKEKHIRECFVVLEENADKEEIKKELKIMCVLFTEDVGGILRLEFDQEGSLNLVTEAFDEDLLYDEIGCELKIKQLQKDKQQLFSSLELFYKVFYLEDY